MNASEIGEGASSQPAPIDMVGSGAWPSDTAGFRIVHTSGERVVATMAEARALMSKLPGARVFRAASQH